MDNQFEISIIDSIIDGKGIRSTRKFLKTVMENFAQESLSFYQLWGEFPFIYSEKQVNSVIVPAIHNYTNNIFLEQPFKKRDNAQRFLDIVTSKGDNIYLIELKHSWNSKTQGTTQGTNNEWKTAIGQIADINRKTIGGYFDCKSDTVFKIVLMVMPTYLASHTQYNILDMSAYEYANELFEEYKLYSSKKFRADFVGTIKLNEPQKYEHEFSHGNQIYPFVSFIAKVEKV